MLSVNGYDKKYVNGTTRRSPSWTIRSATRSVWVRTISPNSPTCFSTKSKADIF